MNHKSFTFRAKVWIYHGVGAWHFVTLPVDESDVIQELYGWRAKGFGSVPVEVTIGKITWKTSIFPDKKAGAYLLPLKAEVRKKENIKNEDLISVKILILP